MNIREKLIKVDLELYSGQEETIDSLFFFFTQQVVYGGDIFYM